MSLFWCPKQTCKTELWGSDLKYCRGCGEETIAAPLCVCSEPISPRVHENKFCPQCGQHWTGQFIGSRLSVVLGEQLEQVQKKLKELV